MSSLRNFLVLALPLASFVFAQPEPQTSQGISSEASDKQEFKELLSVLPEESLHAALDNHLRPKYQEGVYEYDRAAVEKVHEDDPHLASKLVQYAAKIELKKRQTSNSTTSSSDTDTPSSTTTTTTVVTSDSTVVTTVTSSASPQSSPSSNSVTPTSSSESESSTPTPTPTSESSSSTLETSQKPSSHRSLVIITTTLTNGHVQTITSYTIVGPPTGATEGSGPTSTHGAPYLQSGAANVLSREWKIEAAALVGGAVGFAWFM